MLMFCYYVLTGGYFSIVVSLLQRQSGPFSLGVMFMMFWDIARTLVWIDNHFKLHSTAAKFLFTSFYPGGRIYRKYVYC